MLTGPKPDGGTALYSYDSRNRLTGMGTTAYTYNAENNRIGITGPTETTTLVVDPEGALPKVLSRTKNGVTMRYVYGAGLQYEVSSAGVATYYHFDQTGNTAALSNQAGSIIERVAYSPYGVIRYRQSNFDTPFLYGGYFGVMVDSNGLINMRARYYNPATMRFVNMDPARANLNWYAYASNPISQNDPTGLETLVLWGNNYSHPENPDYFKNQATAWSNNSGIKDAVVMPGGSTTNWNAAIGSVSSVDAIVYIGHSGALSGPTKLREGVNVNLVSQPNFSPNASVTLYGCSTGSVSPGDTSNSAQTYANHFGVPAYGATTGVSFGMPVPLTNIDLKPGYVRESGTIFPATMKPYSPMQTQAFTSSTYTPSSRK
jgi:RHS repeat-associated protein